MSDLFDLTGKIALVTGASTGLGSAISLALAQAGADISLVDHHEHKETEGQIHALGRRTLPIVANVQKWNEYLNQFSINLQSPLNIQLELSGSQR